MNPRSERVTIGRKIIQQVARYAILTAIGFVFVLPFALAMLGGFKTDREIFAFPPSVLPDGWTGRGRFEDQRLSENWRIREGWQVISGQSQEVKDGDLLAIDNDGNEIRAVFDGTTTLEFKLTAAYNWEVRVAPGQAVKTGDLLAVDGKGNEIRANADAVMAIDLFLPRREDWQIVARSRQQAKTSDLLAIDEHGQEVLAKFAGAVLLEDADATISTPLALSRLYINKLYTPARYGLRDLFSNELRVVPEEELYTPSQLRTFKEETPFLVKNEARIGWTVRDQYGISNWINVFRAGECRDSWLGPYCFPYWLWNSIFLAAINVTTRVFFAALAGYAFARMTFPGKNVVFTFMLATLMLPGAVTLIPGYVLIADIGWVGVIWSLVVPSLVEVFGIFLMTQFLKSIPKDLEEAARVDGASQWQIIWKVVLPLARPALITLAILSFQASWNQFQGPLLYLRGDPSVFTLPVGLQFFQQQFRQQWNLLLIGSMFNAIPVLIIFLIFNRYFVEGVTYSGVKG